MDLVSYEFQSQNIYINFIMFRKCFMYVGGREADTATYPVEGRGTWQFHAMKISSGMACASLDQEARTS